MQKSDNIFNYKLKTCLDITFKDRLIHGREDRLIHGREDTETLYVDKIISILFIDEMNKLTVVRGRVANIDSMNTRTPDLASNHSPIITIDYSSLNNANFIKIKVDQILDIEDVDFDYKVGFEEKYNEPVRANFAGKSYAMINNETFEDLSKGARVRTGGKERMEHEELVFKSMKTIKELR